MAGILLAREGVEVTVLERDKFPRYKIGESLVTSVLPLLDFVGLRERVEEAGFVKKYGAFFRVKHDLPAGYVDFTQGKHKYSYQVIRSEFDEVVLNYARDMGANVFEEVSVDEVIFTDGRTTGVRWSRDGGTSGTIVCDYVVDGSGLSGVISNRYLNNRIFQDNFANVALGSYWSNVRLYKDDDGRGYPTDFLAEALDDGTGWTWFIPLHNETVSIGVVITAEYFKALRRDESDLAAIYTKLLKRTASVKHLIAEAKMVKEVRSWKDYSYVAKTFSGPNYRLAGDAAGFIDPLFSTGVHLAFLGGLTAAASICAVLRGEVDEKTAAEFHDAAVRKAYTRLLIIVAGVYRQIRDQEHVVLRGIDKRSVQLAFERIRPVVSGNVDLGTEEIDEATLHDLLQFEYDLTLERSLVDSGNAAAKAEHLRLASKAEQIPDDIWDSAQAVLGRRIRLVRGSLGLAEA